MTDSGELAIMANSDVQAVDVPKGISLVADT